MNWKISYMLLKNVNVFRRTTFQTIWPVFFKPRICVIHSRRQANRLNSGPHIIPCINHFIWFNVCFLPQCLLTFETCQVFALVSSSAQKHVLWRWNRVNKVITLLSMDVKYWMFQVENFILDTNSHNCDHLISTFLPKKRLSKCVFDLFLTHPIHFFIRI